MLSRLTALLAAALLCSCVAYADPITSAGTGTYTIAPSSDTFSLNAGSYDIPMGGSFSLDGTFYVGYSPISDQDIAFSIDDSITFNGVTQTVTFNAVDSVTNAADYLYIAELGPVQFGNATLTFGSFTSYGGGSSQNLPASIPVTYEATPAATPEPSSLLLLGTGALSVAGAFRRRLLRA